MHKRGVILRLLSMATMSVVLLAACGRDDDSAEEATEETTEALRVAIILPGRADDFGFSQVGAEALKRVKEEMGADTAIAESVAVDQQVETFRDFASQGYDLVAGWGGQYEDGAEQVSEEFPDVYFTVFLGEGGNGSNYAGTHLAAEQWQFLIGYIDAHVSESGIVGQIAGPCFPGTSWDVHGFEQGVEFAADELQRSIQVKTVALDSFDDPSAAKEAALALNDEGVDIVHTGLNTGNLGVFEAARERGILVSTQVSDQTDEAPDVILTGSVEPSIKALVEAARKVLEGTFDGQPVVVSITADEDAIISFRSHAPDSLFQKAKDLQAAIASGDVQAKTDPSCPY